MQAPKPLDLLHLVNMRSANVGNGALTEGVETILDQDVARKVNWTRLPWDDYTFGLKPFDRDFVDLINRSDGLIVGGAVTMNGQVHYANTGMRFDLPLPLWSEVKRPIVFYGISHRHWKDRPYHHADKLRLALQHMIDSPNVLFGVRNDGTREWIEQLFGAKSDRIHVVPDPAVFVPHSTDDRYPEIEPGRRNVILSFNDEDAEARFGGAERRAEVLKEIARAMESALGKWDINLILAPHYFDDNRMLSDFVAVSKPQLAHQRMISIGSARLGGTRHFYGRYAKADLVISMRVHSMSPCVGLGVPMIPLVTQDRMRLFLKDAGLADLQVDALQPDLAARLGTAIDNALADPEKIKSRFARARTDMRARSQTFSRHIASLFGS